MGIKTVPLLLAGNDRVVGTSRDGLLRVLSKNFDDQYFLPSERRSYAQHFDANGKPQILVYTASWCPSCKSLKQQLKDEGTPFVEFDLHASGEKRAIMDATGVDGYPAVFVGYERVQWNDISAMKSAVKRGAS